MREDQKVCMFIVKRNLPLVINAKISSHSLAIKPIDKEKEVLRVDLGSSSIAIYLFSIRKAIQVSGGHSYLHECLAWNRRFSYNAS